MSIAYPRLPDTGRNGIKKNDAWHDSLVFEETDDDGLVVVQPVPARDRIAMRAADRAGAATGDVLLDLDSDDGDIELAVAGDGFAVSWSVIMTLPVGRYTGDLRLDWDEDIPGDKWTPIDIDMDVFEAHAGG